MTQANRLRRQQHSTWERWIRQNEAEGYVECRIWWFKDSAWTPALLRDDVVREYQLPKQKLPPNTWEFRSPPVMVHKTAIAIFEALNPLPNGIFEDVFFEAISAWARDRSQGDAIIGLLELQHPNK